jgi:hypothetical protein
MISELLADCDVLPWLDDVLIASKTFGEHLSQVDMVLSKLQSVGLLANKEKCEFNVETLTYLGHIISRQGIRPDPAKVRVLAELKPPQDLNELRAFLGLVGWFRPVINGLSTIAEPLTALTRKDVPFSWSQPCQRAFEALRTVLTKEPTVLSYPDPNLPFIVTTDASNVGLGAMLSQVTEGIERPVAFVSRTLTPAEKNYSTTEREALAVIWAIKKWRSYLYLTEFQVRTDHRALSWIRTFKDPSGRIARWQLFLQGYDFTVEHIPGKSNRVADVLSRQGCEDKFVDASVDHIGSPSTPSTDEKMKLLKLYHDSPLGGHFGVARTYSKLASKVSWPGMHKDVEDFVRSCEVCQRRGHRRDRVFNPPLGSLKAESFNSMVAIDVMGPIPTSLSGNTVIIVLVDHFSKFVVAVPAKDQRTETIVQTIINRWVSVFGPPTRLLSDRGSNFLSSQLKDVCDALHVQKIFTTAYHPQGDGVVERMMSTLSSMIAKQGGDRPDWDITVPLLCYAYNSSVHSITGYSPFHCVFGRDSDPFPQASSAPRYMEMDDYVSLIKANIKMIADQISMGGEHIKPSLPALKVGDEVLYFRPVAEGNRHKFASRWTGPYKISRIISPWVVTILLNGKDESVNVRKIKTFVSRTKQPAPAARE